MNTKITNRKTIFVVTRNVNDGDWILSTNVKAFFDKEAADYYAKGLNNKNECEDTWYEVESLELLEVIKDV